MCVSGKTEINNTLIKKMKHVDISFQFLLAMYSVQLLNCLQQTIYKKQTITYFCHLFVYLLPTTYKVRGKVMFSLFCLCLILLNGGVGGWFTLDHELLTCTPPDRVTPTHPVDRVIHPALDKVKDWVTCGHLSQLGLI